MGRTWVWVAPVILHRNQRTASFWNGQPAILLAGLVCLRQCIPGQQARRFHPQMRGFSTAGSYHAPALRRWQ